nr:class I SAM-dependent methyltransferase [uncultured Methanospirillum sp.]
MIHNLFRKKPDKIPSFPTIDSIITMIQEKLSHCSPEEEIRFLLELDNRLYPLIGQASIRYGDGIHTKHRHIKYHDFFIRNIQPGERVLDLGCGNGTCAYDIALNIPDSIVTGIDINHDSIQYARENYSCKNLLFKEADITRIKLANEYDVIVLSNVLEHINERVSFLESIQKNLKPSRWLIRVPVYERDWMVPLKDDLGIDYRLDPTHYIEYKKRELENELNDAELKILSVEHGWGEVWCVVVSSLFIREN